MYLASSETIGAFGVSGATATGAAAGAEICCGACTYTL